MREYIKIYKMTVLYLMYGDGGYYSMEENIVFNTEDVQQNKVFGILAYIGILFLVPLLAAKDSQYARFHTNQGIVLFIAEIILGVLASIITAIFSWIPFIGWIISALIGTVFGILALIYMILGIVNACSGEPKKLPVIGGITILK